MSFSDLDLVFICLTTLTSIIIRTVDCHLTTNEVVTNSVDVNLLRFATLDSKHYILNVHNDTDNYRTNLAHVNTSIPNT